MYKIKYATIILTKTTNFENPRFEIFSILLFLQPLDPNVFLRILLRHILNVRFLKFSMRNQFQI
jgi:hypothetical protein